MSLPATWSPTRYVEMEHLLAIFSFVAETVVRGHKTHTWLNRIRQTKALSGILKRFMMVARPSSGRYSERSDMMEGQKMPTHSSKPQKLSIVMRGESEITAPIMQNAAKRNTPTMNSSERPFFDRYANTVAPMLQEIMNDENTNPSGTFPLSSKRGVHPNTNVYIDPSNND